MRKNGFSSIPVLAVLLVFTMLGGGAVLFTQTLSLYIQKSQNNYTHKKELVLKADEIVQLLLTKKNGEADSPLDLLFVEIKEHEKAGYEITLNDASSLLGINWIRRSVIERLDILDPRFSPEDVQQYRDDTGIHLNLDSFRHFFREDVVLQEHFSPYS